MEGYFFAPNTVNGMEACVTFAEKWWALDPDLREFQNRKRYGGMRDWKLSIQQIVRHEYRHVFQNRKRYGGMRDWTS